MAEVDLLKSTFHGSAGTMTGVKWKNQEVVKQKIWSKAPNSQKGTNSLRAFECLNRLSSAIAKKFWYKLGLTDKKMYKHNAVAKFLAPCVKNHYFDINAIEEIFVNDRSCYIGDFSFNAETKLLHFVAQTELDISPNSPNAWLVIAIDNMGKVYYCDSPKTAAVEVSFYIPIADGLEPYVLTIATTKEQKRILYRGFSISGYVRNRVLYTDLLSLSQWSYDGINKAIAIGQGVAYNSTDNSLIIET